MLVCFASMKPIKSKSVCKASVRYIFFISIIFFAQGSNVEFCDDVHPPPDSTKVTDNCSLVCNVRFQHAVSNTKSDELALCTKNSTIAVLCRTHTDCRKFHVGAYCKWIPCLCKINTGNYILNPSSEVPTLNTCIVSSKYVNPELPLVPFPWRTLLIVCGIVFAFALFLICVRWVSPFIRSMKAKHSARNRNAEQTTQEDGSTLFPVSQPQTDSSPFTYYFAQGMPRIYRAGPRRSYRSPRAAARIQYATCGQTECRNTVSNYPGNQDKPPPYETAIQLPPPAYDDVEQAINDRYNLQLNVHQPSSALFTVTPNS